MSSAIIFEREKNRKTNTDAIDITVKEVMSIWNKMSLPILSVKTIIDKIKKYYQKYLNIVRNLNESKNMPSYKLKYKKFEVNKISHIWNWIV